MRQEKEVTIILYGEPTSTQSCYRTQCQGGFSKLYMTRGCKELKEAWQWEAKNQWKNEPLNGKLSIRLRYFFRTKRKCDLDNFNKLTLDALTGVLYTDDSQIDELTIIRGYDKITPRVEILCSELAA